MHSLPNIIRNLKSRQLKWAGYVARMEQSRVLIGKPEGKRPLGRPRHRWAGHVQRMAEHEIPKKIMGNKFEGKRSVGQPRLRWMDGVLEDLRKLRIKRMVAGCQG